MNDRSISSSKLITAALWALSVAVMSAAWWVYAAIGHESAIMVATTGVVPLAGAVVSHVRCYSLQICGLLRAAKGFNGPLAAEVHRLR